MIGSNCPVTVVRGQLYCKKKDSLLRTGVYPFAANPLNQSTLLNTVSVLFVVIYPPPLNLPPPLFYPLFQKKTVQAKITW